MSNKPSWRPSISVLAGANGAGKSSVAGSSLRARGGDYFNPDEATRRILEADPGIGLAEANSRAWLHGKRLLENAIARRVEFAFETTLGGNTIFALLEKAHSVGSDVRMWYVGLESPELHIVRARVVAGGHDIPEGRIRERYERSRQNLIRLLPALTELWVFDNSEEVNPETGVGARPRLLLHVADRVVRDACDFHAVPQWAKPLVIAALREYAS